MEGALKGVRIGISGIEMDLLCERAVVCERSLFVADLHLGKSQSLRSFGAPVPGGDAEEQLLRLGKLIAETRAERVIVLGDFLHAGVGLTDGLVEMVSNWRRGLPIPCCVVRGNHDRAIDEVAAAWNIDLADPGAVFCGLEAVHDPCDASRTRAWIGGHVHPAVRIGGVANALKLPCFHIVAGHGLLLPAFSLFTGGACVRPSPSDRVIGVAGNRLIEIGRTRQPGPSEPVCLTHAVEPEEAGQAET